MFEPEINNDSMTLTYILKCINNLVDTPIIYVNTEEGYMYSSRPLDYRVFYCPFYYGDMEIILQ